MNELSHVDDRGNARMVDVSGKQQTVRVAKAEGLLRIKHAHHEALGKLEKGDAFVVAQVAGIQGGKRCSDLIPLCHPVALSDLKVEISLMDEGIRILAEAQCFGVTGVEMEAYTAVAIAGVTLIDMLKGVDPDLELTRVRLMEKTGGKNDFRRT